MTRSPGVLLATAAILAAIPRPAGARTILFDESHGQVVPMYSDASFDGARAALRRAGHSLAVLKGSGAIRPDVLARVQVFFTGTLEIPLGAGEIKALLEFVAQGGGLVVGHDGGYSSSVAVPSINELLAPWGMAISVESEHATGVVVADLVPHCLTSGVRSLGLDYLRPLVRIEPPAKDLTKGGVETLAVYDNGAGWVIVLGDDNLWTDDREGSDHYLGELDNHRMLLNVFGYTSCPKDGGAPSGGAPRGAAAWGGPLVRIPAAPVPATPRPFRLTPCIAVPAGAARWRFPRGRIRPGSE